MEIKEFVNNYTLVDIETTGLNPIEDEIIEISAYKVRNNNIIDTYSSLIKPKNKLVSSFISNLTGITNMMLFNERDINIVLPEFLNFLGDDIILGHNVKFDISFLKDKSIKYLNKNIDNNYVDNLMLSRKLLPSISHSLENLSHYFNLDTTGEHRALKDVDLTYKVYNELRKIYEKNNYNN